MINPGVIKLFSSSDSQIIGIGKRYEIEDNIGEKIHIHYDNLRLDLTIKDFEKLAMQCSEILKRLVAKEDFSLDEYDPLFLAGIAGYLPFLEKIEYENIELEKLKVDVTLDDGSVELQALPFSRVYQSINGDSKKDDAHKQINSFGIMLHKMSNKERVESVIEMMKTCKYPEKTGFITINENYQICDGQHRAAALYYLKGNIKITVRKLLFRKKEEKLETSSIQTKQVLDNLLEFCHLHKNIYLYGAGLYGRKYKYLLESKDVKIKAFITTEKEKNEYFGVPVLELREYLDNSRDDDGIILAFNGADQECISKITKQDISNVFNTEHNLLIMIVDKFYNGA